MPTRSMEIPLQLGVSEWCDIWTTHRLVNERAAWFMERLVMIRGRETWVSTGDEALARRLGHPGGGQSKAPGHDDVYLVTAEMVRRARKAWFEGRLKPGQTLQMLEGWETRLETLYAAIVPSGSDEDEEAGSSSKANQKASHFTGWLVAPSSEAQPAGLASETRDWFRDYGLRPLWTGYKPLARQDRKGAFLTEWDRLAFKLAIARLMSWESWNARARREYMERQEALGEAKTAFLEAPRHLREIWLAYEAARHAELLRISELTQEDRPYRLGRRALRGFSALCHAWRVQPSDLKGVADGLQYKDPREFPDRGLVEWILDHPGADAVWREPQGADTGQRLARLNWAAARLEAKQEQTILTLPDPQRHPLWVEFDPPSNTNQPPMDLQKTQDGKLIVSMELLRADASGIVRSERMIPLGPNPQCTVQQLEHLEKEKKGKKDGEAAPEVEAGGRSKGRAGQRKDVRITYIQAPSQRSATRRETERWTGMLQAPSLLLDRRAIESEAFNPSASPVRAYLKLVMNLDTNAIPGAEPLRPLTTKGEGLQQPVPAWARIFSRGLGKAKDAKKAAEELEAFKQFAGGKRIMQVDLGLRSLAAVTAFELRTDGAGVALPWCPGWTFQEDEAFARLLELEGEGTIPPEIQVRRNAARAALALMKRMKSRRTQLLRLTDDVLDPVAFGEKAKALAQGRPTEDDERAREAYEALCAPDDPPVVRGHRAQGNRGAIRPVNLMEGHERVLRQVLGFEPREPPKDRAEALMWLESWDEAINDAVRVWRGREKRRDPGRRRLHGKSLWALEYLTDVRRFLIQWNRRGATSRDTRRLEEGFATHLLDHLNNLRNDRIKEGANLIVNTARGLVYDEDSRAWVQRREPCQLIVLENLNRYRFDGSRSRAENGQLMQWNHRELAKEIAQMAELFGIGVMTTFAAWSSQMHGRTGAPGVRCRKVSQEDLDSMWFRKRVGDPLPALDGWIPWPGGKGFATLGTPDPEDADINAARSLARRFLLRHGEAFRLRAVLVGSTYVPASWGSRIEGALGGWGHLRPSEDGDGWLWTPGGKKAKAVQNDEEESIDSEPETLDDEGPEGVERGHALTFFRDPSGRVLKEDRWHPAPEFWKRVKASVGAVLQTTDQPF